VETAVGGRSTTRGRSAGSASAGARMAPALGMASCPSSTCEGEERDGDGKARRLPRDRKPGGTFVRPGRRAVASPSRSSERRRPRAASYAVAGEEIGMYPREGARQPHRTGSAAPSMSPGARHTRSIVPGFPAKPRSTRAGRAAWRAALRAPRSAARAPAAPRPRRSSRGWSARS
jgi:hypothetical protein